jgi:tetratricopeptide (TPR) repeat protein
MRHAFVGLVCVLACRAGAVTESPGDGESAVTAEPARAAEAMSLFGEPLHAPPLPPDVLAEREAKLAEAQAALQAHPDDLEAIVWVGRRLAYLGKYRQAIDAFTAGLAVHPQAPELYRHRGHRFITIRRFDDAVTDLRRAAELIEGQPDVVEVDGLPNPAGVPTGTRRTNVLYHLALAHYLRNELEPARAAYRACLDASTTDDMRVATSHWLYMTLRRMGRHDEAAVLLEPIRAEGMTIHENHAYHRLLLMYRGEVAPEELLAPDAEAIDAATLGYGLGTWHLVEGRAAEARTAYEAVLRTENWAAFGFIAAEAQLAAQ